MIERGAATAAAAVQQRTTQAQAQADEARTAAAQVNFQEALDAMAKLRDTIDKRTGRLFPDEQKG